MSIQLSLTFQDYTREYDIQRIIDDFEAREVYNFSLYNLLNEVCAETVILSRDVKKIRREIGLYIHNNTHKGPPTQMSQF